MPKPSRGGRRSTTGGYIPRSGGFGFGNTAGQVVPPSQSTQPVDDDEQDVLSTDSSGEQNESFDEFRKMSKDEQADVISEALKEAPPSFLPDNASQRVLAYLGGDNKPTIVPDKQLDGMSGKDIYRQVGGFHDPKFGVNLSSQQIANQVMTGDLTQYAQDWGQGQGGGTAWGRAIYFGASYGEIQSGYGRGAIRGQRDSTLFRCKISPTAKGMTYSALRQAVAREVSSGSKLGRVLGRIGNSDDRETIYALARGIDYTHDGYYDYHMVYNRGCLVASDRLKHNANDSKW